MDLGELPVIPECRVILASKDSLVLRELLDSLAKLVLLDSLALVDPQVQLASLDSQDQVASKVFVARLDKLALWDH